MKISSKGMYALRLMLDLAVNDTGEYIPLKVISKRQELSEKFLEQTCSLLTRAGFIRSVRGSGGGYRLTNRPETYTMGMILRLTERSLFEDIEDYDNDADDGFTNNKAVLASMKSLSDKVNQVMDEVTLSDLVEQYHDSRFDDYVI